MSDSTVAIGADLTKLRRELAKLPNLSADAAQKTLIKVEKAVSRAETAAKRSAATVKRAAKSAERATSKSLKSTADGLKGLFEIGGGSGEVFEKLNNVMSALTNPVGAVTVGLGALGLAISGAVVGGVALVKTAEDLAEKLEPVGGALAIPPDAIESIERANDAMRTVSAVAERVVVQLATELAPVIEQVATLLVKLGLIFLDQMKLVSEGEGVFYKALSRMSEAIVAFLLGPVDKAITLNSQLVGGIAELADVAGADGLAAQLRKTSGAWDDFKAGLGDKIVDKTLEGIGVALEGLDEATADYDARARELIGTIGKLDDQAKKATDRLKGYRDILFLLADASRNLRDQRALAAMLEDVEATSAGAIRNVRALHDQVDELVPPKALDEVDRLQLLLFDLEQAAIASGGANAILAENIERVKARMEDLNSEGTLLGGLLAKLDERFPQLGESLGRVGEVGEKVFRGIGKAVDTALGLVTRLIQGFLRFVEVAGGLDLSSLFGDSMSAQGEGGGSLDGIVSAMVTGATKAIGEFVGRLDEVIGALVDKLPGLMQAVAANLGPVTDALLDAALSIFDVLEGQEPRILKLAERLAGKLVEFIEANASRLVKQALQFGSDLLVTLLDGVPMLIEAVLEALPSISLTLLDGIGDVVVKLVEGADDIIASLIDALPKLVTAISMKLPEISVRILAALTKLGPQLTIALTKQLLETVGAVWSFLKQQLTQLREQGFVEYVKSLWDKVKGQLRQWILELFSGDGALGDLANTAQTAFNDTPGAVQVGMRGLTARFAPGDKVVAAKDARELKRQADRAAGASGSGARVSLDLTDGHLAFERMFKRSRRAGGELSKLLGPQTGQVKVYG